MHWVAQISANLLRDEELVDLIAASGGKWVFIGMESIDPTNLADVKKGFNKPGEYAAVLERLAQTAMSTPSRHSSSAWTTTRLASPSGRSRKFAPGRRGCRSSASYAVARDAALQKAARCGPADPSEALAGVHSLRDGTHAAEDDYRRSACGGEVRLDEIRTVPRQWLEAVDSLRHKPLGYRINIFIARMCFRGIYFPQMGPSAWLKVISQNWDTISHIAGTGFGDWLDNFGKRPGRPTTIGSLGD